MSGFGHGGFWVLGETAADLGGSVQGDGFAAGLDGAEVLERCEDGVGGEAGRRGGGWDGSWCGCGEGVGGSLERVSGWVEQDAGMETH